MDKQGYSISETETAHGVKYEFDGPGMLRHERGVHLPLAYEAETVARLLARAFEAGRQDKAREVLGVLGVHNTPWGVQIG